MVPKYNQGSEIVSSRPGSGTTDTIYRCADGSEWLFGPYTVDITASSQTVGAPVGKLVDNRIVRIR